MRCPSQAFTDSKADSTIPCLRAAPVRHVLEAKEAAPISVAIGISYVLAGSEAYAALFHTSHIYIIPAFTWALSLGILVAQVIIQPIMSLLTLLKGILLIITVVVTFVVGSEVHQETKNDFTQIGKPFLMGTVALGGIVNIMPFLFSEINHNKTQVLGSGRDRSPDGCRVRPGGEALKYQLGPDGDHSTCTHIYLLQHLPGGVGKGWRDCNNTSNKENGGYNGAFAQTGITAS
ncbi:uncharacterized protein DAT39_000314 [Clarias magur]|uniref:Uncharacterized protein n=1 Tax=Clarias magur TaxID=1594786 RepID=A0A8J4XJF8_CLAMG|nr:uncharacterized protein DAT39_000314 [Clarias magur]